MIFPIATVLTISGTLVYLAGTTSVLLLLVFASVNLARTVIERRSSVASDGFHAPHVVPLIGFLSSLILIAFLPPASLITATVILAIGVLLVFVWRIRNSKSENS